MANGNILVCDPFLYLEKKFVILGWVRLRDQLLQDLHKRFWFLSLQSLPLLFNPQRDMRSSGTNWKLADHPKLLKGKTIAMIVLDGWGKADPDRYNCIHVTDTPTVDSFKKEAVGGFLRELKGFLRYRLLFALIMAGPGFQAEITDNSNFVTILASQGVNFLLSGEGQVPLSSCDGKIICLFFSANWCRPFKTFLPQLLQLYNSLLSEDKRVDIIFISFDRDENVCRYYNDLHVFNLDQFKVKKSCEQRPNSLDYENVNSTETEESATNGKDGSLECQEQEVDTKSSINDLSQNMASVIVDDGALSAPSDEGKAEGSKAQSNFFSFQKQL